MTVTYRDGSAFRNGWTWHISVPYMGVRDNIPCFECYWDEEGKVERTGRRALLHEDVCRFSQNRTPDPSRQLEEGDPRLCSREEYHDRWVALNEGHRDLTAVPERLRPPQSDSDGLPRHLDDPHTG
jgi:hypothetical protein